MSALTIDVSLIKIQRVVCDRPWIVVASMELACIIRIGDEAATRYALAVPPLGIPQSDVFSEGPPAFTFRAGFGHPSYLSGA